MDEFITQEEVIKLMGVNTTAPKSYFNNMKIRGNLEGFPRPLQRVNRKTVYSKDRVIEWLNGKYNKPDFLGFMAGHYAPDRLQTKWILKRMRARQNKPKTVTVRLKSEW